MTGGQLILGFSDRGSLYPPTLVHCLEIREIMLAKLLIIIIAI